MRRFQPARPAPHRRMTNIEVHRYVLRVVIADHRPQVPHRAANQPRIGVCVIHRCHAVLLVDLLQEPIALECNQTIDRLTQLLRDKNMSFGEIRRVDDMHILVVNLAPESSGAFRDLVRDQPIMVIQRVDPLFVEVSLPVALMHQGIDVRAMHGLAFGVGIGGEDRHEIEACEVDPRTRGRRCDESLECIGGHLRRATVALTLEVAMWEITQPLIRRYDDETGLNTINVVV